MFEDFYGIFFLENSINLAFCAECREESYTMFACQKESLMAGPWATVHTLTYDSAGTGNMVNYGYTAPGSAANGMPGTSPDAAGVFNRTNTAFYADVEYALGEALLLQFAARSENFSDFGSTSNIKVAGRYSLGDLVTLRGGYSTGFRAPTPGQSNYTGIVTSFDGVTGTQVQEGTVKPTDPLAVLYGGKELGAETAVNTSFGFTSSPIDNLNLTFDMYQIDIEGKILKSRSISVDDPNFSELAFYTNALDTKTSGYDLVATYRMGNTNLGLAMNHNETEVVKQNQVNGQNPVSDGNVQNLEENLPKDRITATVTQDIGDALSLMVRLNNYGESIDERSDKDVIDPITFIDVELSYSVSNNLNVVFGANNVTNAYPNEIDTRASQGMPYPRRSPLGYHGGMTYIRLMYDF